MLDSALTFNFSYNKSSLRFNYYIRRNFPSLSQVAGCFGGRAINGHSSLTFLAGKILDSLNLPHRLFKRWGTDKQEDAS